MKKFISVIVSIMILFSLSACSENETKEPISAKSTTRMTTTEFDGTTFDSILAGIHQDVVYLWHTLDVKTNEIYELTGKTADGYLANKNAVTEWFDYMLTESENLFKRTDERIVGYYKLVASSIDHNDKEAIEKALDKLYTGVYDTSYTLFAVRLNEGPFQVFYDDFYYDLLYDVPGLEEEAKELCDAWNDADQKIVALCQNNLKNFESNLEKIRTEFKAGNFDVDSILA